MPKKHQPKYASIKPTYVHPSLQSSRNAASSSDPPPAQTVNDRLSRLRHEQALRATAQRRDEITEVVSHRTVPPALRRILHMAEVDAPKPKPGRRRPLSERPPPGPAAPTSWLKGRRAWEYTRSSQAREEHGNGIGRLCKLAIVHDAEFQRIPTRERLAHHCLRTFAMHWTELAEYEQHYLPALPIGLKEAMLSYLSLYGERSCMDFESFKILFQKDSENIQFLDLTGLLNERFALKDLKKSLQRLGLEAAVTSGMANVSISSSTRHDKAPVEVADSWEDEAEDSILNVLPMTLIPIFPNLTRLSLAHAGTAASWTELLSLSPCLNTLTHLSLAYWPRPSTTPNGGPNFDGDTDDEWLEAANVLRRLSLNTYCLKWLDLEGCTWLKALTWGLPSSAPPHVTTADTWTRPSSSPGPDWNGAWRQIVYVNFFQGWFPSEIASLQSAPSGLLPIQIMAWLKEHGTKPRVKGLRTGGVGSGGVWVEQEKAARGVELDIKSLRSGVGKYCAVDYGWGGKA